MPAKNWYDKLIEEYHKELGLKDKLHLIQKLLKEIDHDLYTLTQEEKAKSP